MGLRGSCRGDIVVFRCPLVVQKNEWMDGWCRVSLVLNPGCAKRLAGIGNSTLYLFRNFLIGEGYFRIAHLL